jgi:asparagine N-glycosylation enzyme membrane subunit Stt3
MKGYIYKIVSISTNRIHIGSTNKDINIWYKRHKNAYDNYIDGNSNYCTSYQIFKYNDSKIETIKEAETITSLELKNRIRRN